MPSHFAEISNVELFSQLLFFCRNFKTQRSTALAVRQRLEHRSLLTLVFFTTAQMYSNLYIPPV